MPREPVADHLDEYEHFGNRRLRTVGELIQEAFRIGLYRMERVVRERLTTEDADTITPQTIVEHPPGRRGAEGVLRLLAALAVHGPDELAGRPDAPPPPLGARRRRPDARARADRGARRPPDPLRPHVPDRDAGGPEHRPDRLAVELRRGLRARLRHDALPRRQGRRRHRRDRPPGRHPGGGAADRAGQHAARREDRQAQGPRRPLPHAGRPVRDGRAQGRRPHGRLARADLVGRDGDDPVPRARRRQPRADGLEHAAPGRAAARRPTPRSSAPAWSAAPRSTPATSCSPATPATVAYVDADADRRRGQGRQGRPTSCRSSCAPTRAR